MECIGALASSLQIVSQCAQITFTIIQWVESVKTVDERIDTFVNEVNTLKATYESLNQSLKDSSMLEAATLTNRDVGGHLWAQMSRTLQDCEGTMTAITNVLRKIRSSSTIFRSVIKQLRESLTSGELVRLRAQVVMFNSCLQLPMHMITLTLQLKQQEMTAQHQLRLNDQLTSLRRGIDRVEQMSKRLVAPRRQDSYGDSTLIGYSAGDKVWLDNMETYVGTAKKFLDSASVAASTRSAPSTNLQEDDTISRAANEMRRGSAFVPLSYQQLQSINLFVDDLPTESGAGTGTPLASDAQSTTDPSQDMNVDSDDDVDLQLLEALLHNGHAQLDRADYAAAEDNYREALGLSHDNDFGSRIACSNADITLMLGQCLVKQEKYTETIKLLQPLADQAINRVNPHSSSSSIASLPVRSADQGQALSASHLLGQVYLKTSDHVNAEKEAVQAFKGRKKLLGQSHDKTIESVVLVIDVYRAKGQNARAEAHRIFLKPAQSGQNRLSTQSNPMLSDTSSPQPTYATAVPTNTPKTRRPTFNFSSAFKRTERVEVTPTNRAMTDTSGLGSPFLMADEFNTLSTSPHDTSSLYLGSDIGSVERQLADESSSYRVPLRQWTTAGDVADQLMDGHQRSRGSLSKTPTLYAAMSRSEMEQKFVEISDLCRGGKSGKAVEKGVALLRRYDPGAAMFLHRADELKENIKKSKTKGLAGTGYGFAPLHFFCSLSFEAGLEVDILLALGVDVDAMAYKAGYTKSDPFTSLSLAVERGHDNIVRVLLEKGATWKLDVIKSGDRFNADRDTIHPILQACSRGYAGITKMLLDQDMELSEEIFPRSSWHGNSLLHEACFKCDLGMVETLMNHARQHDVLHKHDYSFVGRPGQQDIFGVTPIMYAVDMRDCKDPKLKAHKMRNRVACLSLLLESTSGIQVQDNETGEVVVDHLSTESPGMFASDLHIEDKRGNTVYWYADESRGGDRELRTFLEEQGRRSRLIEL